MRRLATAWVAFAVAVASPAKPRTQVRAEYDTSTLGMQQALLRLPQTASLFHTGAHLDDVDSALIARLARGDHARVGYLSLNRGEGGQNTIGRGTLGGELAPVQAAVDRALASRKPLARSDTIPPLTEGLTALRTAEARVPSLALDDPLVIVPVSPRLTERVAALLKE